MMIEVKKNNQRLVQRFLKKPVYLCNLQNLGLFIHNKLCFDAPV